MVRTLRRRAVARTLRRGAVVRKLRRRAPGVGAGLTRRQLVLGGAGGALSTALGTAPAAAAAVQAGDRAQLSRVLEVERLLVWGYEHVLTNGTLDSGARSVVARQLEHERDHLAALGRALLATPAPPLSGRGARAQLAHHAGVANPDRLATRHASLRFLVDLESVAEGAWFAALAKIESPPMALLATRIMACEAQHWTVLSGLSHHGDPMITVPNAFVRGIQ